ncbi:hypothetical protein SAMN05421690_10561 [Nitrosomonas sp. Nm51]|uniref:hypothetical protein n=1 Tax=Nitrosomonas sp. Nm51 TaxID=133720 RepID=UPI0008B80504|nr:hypothetical protein [Nitrosomonas sp. Nm51]SER70200.1 hypothetical protein SAMN05421690_10561 [Nitrosomonas sp. Nm51]
MQRWRPLTEVSSASLTQLSHDPLGIPVPDTALLHALFAYHAPVWEVDVVDENDLPGIPIWNTAGKPGVKPAPVVYRYPSYTRWQDQTLLQLNYVVWFAARPITGIFDILGGALDGLIWRVTLNSDGAPLLYDTIHPCGCYHMFFLTEALQPKPEALQLAEPPLLPQPAPRLTAGQRIVIRIASAAHYIERVYADQPDGTPYEWRDYAELYATPVIDSGRRSLFAGNGLVIGSERRERWLLWPMGIPSAGAMRERGHHATAFVGRRHFDDALLLEGLFQPAP